jgi:ABC-type multidrug transport system ATPase subunit
MARRVALARALALDPPLMIYDEPLTGLDPIASGVVMSLVRRLNDTLGLTSIVVTHHVHETMPIADHAIVIANGAIVFSGTPRTAMPSPDPLCASSSTASPTADSVRYRRRARRRPPDALRRRHRAPGRRGPVRTVGVARVEAHRAISSPSSRARSTRSARARCRSWRRRCLRGPVGRRCLVIARWKPTARPAR